MGPRTIELSEAERIARTLYRRDATLDPDPESGLSQPVIAP